MATAIAKPKANPSITVELGEPSQNKGNSHGGGFVALK